MHWDIPTSARFLLEIFLWRLVHVAVGRQLELNLLLLCGVHITVYMALLVYLLCQPVYSGLSHPYISLFLFRNNNVNKNPPRKAKRIMYYQCKVCQDFQQHEAILINCLLPSPEWKAGSTMACQWKICHEKWNNYYQWSWSTLSATRSHFNKLFTDFPRMKRSNTIIQTLN